VRRPGRSLKDRLILQPQAGGEDDPPGNGVRNCCNAMIQVANAREPAIEADGDGLAVA
jgi:hypothetical protein